ncbi:hypothetical protein [Crocosphaera watsonii]|uniref:hypothetical protein n=1 Tax=Crocosphaera watsonii TaxID=263511 RepID=UPI0030D81F24
MLNQFRKHYPGGSLVSELVSIDHGKYIVRVLLQNDNVTLSTGLAADEKIEAAEDRAIERALNNLQLEVKPVAVTEKIAVQPSPSPPEITQPKSTVAYSSPPPEKTVEPVVTKNEIKEIETEPEAPIKIKTETPTKSSKKRVKTTTNSKQSPSIQAEIEEKPLPIVETPQEPEIEEKPLPIVETSQKPEIEETPLPIVETPQEPEIEETSLPISEITEEPEIEEKPPVEEELLDFSEIIARSNVELKRLKWTTEQGREYLVKTYGKRSRQVLSDGELLEFLRYLEGLPTPS